MAPLKNTVLRPLQARHSFDIHNEKPGFSKDTVILPKSVGATELGLEDMRALSEAPYKTSALQAHYSINVNRLATSSNDYLYESRKANDLVQSKKKR